MCPNSRASGFQTSPVFGHLLYLICSRCKYGRQLQLAIKSFLSDFVQHMKEEEAVFGPLLKENFERKELEDMNETVLKQHTLFREKVRQAILPLGVVH